MTTNDAAWQATDDQITAEIRARAAADAAAGWPNVGPPRRDPHRFGMTDHIPAPLSERRQASEDHPEWRGRW